MQKIRIVSLEDDKENVIVALHVMGALDLRKSKLNIEDDRPAVYSTEISDSLVKVSGALQLLSPQSVKPQRHLGIGDMILEVKKLSVINEIYSLGDERKLVQEDQRAVDYAERMASAFSELNIDFSKLRSDYLNYKAFETDSKGIKAFGRRTRNAAAKDIEVHVVRSGKKDYLVFMAYAKGSPVDELFKGIKFNELDLAAKYLEGKPDSIISNARRRRAQNASRLSDIERRLADISSKYYSRLESLREMLEIELQRADLPSNFKRTQKTFVVEGWVQKRQVGELNERLANVTKGRVEVEELDGEGELAPTFTRRPRFLQPFDYLVSFYSVQRSDEIDPTWIFILSFPIFYGLMVTDVGYGIASFILATIITKKTDSEGLMYNAAKVWQLNAIAAVFFGVLSNQYFGFSLPYSTPFSFNWLKNTPELIAITIFFGIAQVILGLAIGIVNSYNHGHKKIAIAKFTSILVVAFGTIAVAGAFFGAFNAPISEAAAGVAVVSLLLTGVLSGIEATEITNLITHPLSYARLMGFALGSVIIAFLIDMAFTPHLGGGIVGILVFLLFAVIFIALHFLNMVLSIFEGLVQGVRLNFVEFFSKFYIGNGIPFRPFKYKRVYTKE